MGLSEHIWPSLETCREENLIGPLPRVGLRTIITQILANAIEILHVEAQARSHYM